MTAFAWSGHIVALVSSTDLFTPWIKQIKRGFVWQSYFCCHGPVLKVKTFHEKFHFLTKYYQFKSPPAYAIPVLRELLSSMHHRPFQSQLLCETTRFFRTTWLRLYSSPGGSCGGVFQQNQDLILCPKNCTSWWLNQPSWKIWSSKWESSPIFGVNIKNIWNHHLVVVWKFAERNSRIVYLTFGWI